MSFGHLSHSTIVSNASSINALTSIPTSLDPAFFPYPAHIPNNGSSGSSETVSYNPLFSFQPPQLSAATTNSSSNPVSLANSLLSPYKPPVSSLLSGFVANRGNVEKTISDTTPSSENSTPSTFPEHLYSQMHLPSTLPRGGGTSNLDYSQPPAAHSNSQWKSLPHVKGGSVPNRYQCSPSWRASYTGYSNLSENLDLNNPRRKNVTRESTSTLKAWLQEHIRNPYPTKGEKIMLAIITKMTLTQVSTWFANARRRLKKENKICWSPQPRNDDDNDDDFIEEDEDKIENIGSADSEVESSRKSFESSAPVFPNSTPFLDNCDNKSANRIWSLARTAATCSPLSLHNNNNNNGGNYDCLSQSSPINPINLIQSQNNTFPGHFMAQV